MDSFPQETNNSNFKTPLENLQDILAKADAEAAAVLPPQTQAIFSIEGDESEAATEEESAKLARELPVSKTRLRSVLTAVEQFPQERLSRQYLANLLAGFNEHHSTARKIVYSENIKKLDELIKAFKCKSQ